MDSSLIKRGLGIAIAAVLVIGTYMYLESRPGSNAREDLIAELQTYEHFDKHQQLLMQTLDGMHDDLADRLTQRRGAARAHYYDLDYAQYRNEVYNAMIRALREAGHETDAIALDRHRASNRSR